LSPVAQALVQMLTQAARTLEALQVQAGGSGVGGASSPTPG
jgi:hypothetical protein